MKPEWNDRRCIRCTEEATLTKEHLIPRSVGGALECKFVCKPCNDRLGQIEANLKSDPAVRLAVENLKDRVPNLWRTMSEGQSYIAKSRAGTVNARFGHGKIRVNPSQQPDGSLIHPTEKAPNVARKMLQKDGATEAQIQEAIRKFEQTPEDSRVTIANGIDIVKWSITETRPALDGELLNPVVPMKIAYEYLALHYGEAIFNTILDPVRETLGTGERVPETCLVEQLRASQHRPFHGLIVEDNLDHAVVQIRLFGHLVYRVHFIGVLIAGGPLLAYTLHLDTGKEDLCET